MKQVGASKRLLIIIALIAIAGFINSASGQDILKLKSGREIKVIIVEEKPDIVSYREFENPESPLYSIAMDKVESIKYKKGRTQADVKTAVEVKKEKEEPITGNNQLTAKKRYVLLNDKIQSPRQVKLLMEDYPEAFKIYTSGRKNLNASNSCAMGIVGVSLITNLISNGMKEGEGRKVLIAGLSISGGLVISGIVLASSGKKKLRESVRMYNSAVTKPVSLQIGFNLSEAGFGVVMRF